MGSFIINSCLLSILRLWHHEQFAHGFPTFKILAIQLANGTFFHVCYQAHIVGLCHILQWICTVDAGLEFGFSHQFPQLFYITFELFPRSNIVE